MDALVTLTMMVTGVVVGVATARVVLAGILTLTFGRGPQ